MVEVLASYRALVGVAVGCGLVIAGFFEATKAPIEANRAALLQAAIRTTVPGSSSHAWLAVNEAGKLEEVADPARAEVYRVKDAGDEVIGFAIEAIGMGYQDRIRMLWAYKPATVSLNGYVVLENRETPGLGARIASDHGFLTQFVNVPVLDASGQILPQPLVVVPTGTARAPGEIDGLTGATISTRAVVDILNRSLARWLPLITAYQEQP